MPAIFARHFFSPIANILMLKPLFQSEKIIIHSLASPFLLLYLCLFPSLIKKSYWVIWGKDLYFYRSIERKHFHHRLYEFLRRRVIKNIRHIITFIDGDFELAKKWYGCNAIQHQCFMYPSNLYKHLPPANKKGGAITILVGNSADPSNNHLEAFELLRKYKNDDIELIVPLSYGDKKYAMKVTEAGTKIFGNKFLALEKLLPFTEYMNLLKRIDIGVFAHNRQQAMGNMISLLGMGKKIYIRNSITTWNLFNSMGIYIFNLDNFDINPLNDIEKKNNTSIIKSVFSDENLLRDWSRISEDIP